MAKKASPKKTVSKKTEEVVKDENIEKNVLGKEETKIQKEQVTDQNQSAPEQKVEKTVDSNVNEESGKPVKEEPAKVLEARKIFEAIVKQGRITKEEARKISQGLY